MDGPGGPPRAGDGRDDYSIDDLVAHEKGQIKLVAGFLVLAVIFVGGRNLVGDAAPGPAPAATPAPVTSADR